MREQIEKALQSLVGLPLWDWSRAADMACFGFGARRPSTARSGEPIVIAEWTLHIQCTWRIVGPTGIVVGRRDLFYPAVEVPDLDPDQFDYESAIPNRRDVHLEQLFADRAADPLRVEHCAGDQFGGFCLRFQDGWALDVFPDDSSDCEHWRLLPLSRDSRHFVITGRGIE